MEIKQKQNKDTLEINIAGDLDASSAIEIDKVIKKANSKGIYKLIINCENLDYISSAGVGVFVSYIEDFNKKKGKFVFYKMKDNVLNVQKIMYRILLVLYLARPLGLV